ncbi:MAG: porin family protein [Chitinophagales bacterium]|nr:porin family protein [Chitinophagales bacterium]
MKKLLFLLCLFAATSVLKAQDSTQLQKAKEKVAQSGSRDRLVIDFGYDRWIDDIDSIKSKRFSRSFGFTFMYDILLGKSRFSIAPGLGIYTHSVFLDHQLVKGTDSTETTFADFGSDYKKYKLNTVYLDIPLELRFRSKPNKHNKSVKVAAGFKAGVLINSHTKLIHDGPDGDREVVKVKNFTDLSRFRYGPTLRIGYAFFNVFAYYSVGELFNDGPQKIHPLTVGISINGL